MATDGSPTSAPPFPAAATADLMRSMLGAVPIIHGYPSMNLFGAMPASTGCVIQPTRQIPQIQQTNPKSAMGARLADEFKYYYNSIQSEDATLMFYEVENIVMKYAKIHNEQRAVDAQNKYEAFKQFVDNKRKREDV